MRYQKVLATTFTASSTCPNLKIGILRDFGHQFILGQNAQPHIQKSSYD